ncbi:MAG: hypothetical protein ABJH05_08840 [Fulvivirga sp.]
MSLVIQEMRKDYLYVKLVGNRNFFAEMLRGLCQLGALANGNSSKKILLDYSEVELNFSYYKSSIFRLLNVYENQLDNSKIVCLVINENYLEDGKLFISLCKSRGMNNEVFVSLKEAELWLKSL